MADIDTLFEKVLELTEKSVEAWSKAYNKLEDLSKDIDRHTQDYKDLDNIVRQKPCILDTAHHAQLETKLLNECEDIKSKQDFLLKKLEEIEKDKRNSTAMEKQITLWLRLATGAVILIGTVIGTIVALSK